MFRSLKYRPIRLSGDQHQRHSHRYIRYDGEYQNSYILGDPITYTGDNEISYVYVSTVISIEDSAEGSTPGSESSFLHPVKGKQTEAVTKEAASNILTVLFIFLCIKTIRINTFSLQKSIPKPHIKNDYNKHNLNSYPDYGTN